MVKRFSTNFAILCAVLDGFFVVIAIRLANLLRPILSSYISGLANIQAPVEISQGIYIFSVILWILVLSRMGIYDPDKNFRVVDEVYGLLTGTFISLVIISGFLYIINSQISRLLFLSFGGITFMLQLACRLFFRLIRKHKNTKLKNKQRILIVGAGIIGRKFEKEINGYSEYGYELVGYLDDDPDAVIGHNDILGRTDQAKEVIEKYQIDDLIVALPRRAYQRTDALIEEVHELPVRVWVIPDYFALMLITEANVSVDAPNSEFDDIAVAEQRLNLTKKVLSSIREEGDIDAPLVQLKVELAVLRLEDAKKERAVVPSLLISSVIQEVTIANEQLDVLQDLKKNIGNIPHEEIILQEEASTDTMFTPVGLFPLIGLVVAYLVRRN